MNGEVIEATVSRIETKLDLALEALKDHEARLRKCESDRWVMRAILLIGGLCTGLLAKVGVHIG